MKIAVGLRWKSRVNAPLVLPCLNIIIDDIPDKIRRRRLGRYHGVLPN
jgi:hypothetical protein